jgi:outer membrane protein OmpA-like peptidoglycan-associated protein
VGNYLDKQARELEQVAETERTENGILLKMPSEFLFATDSAQLNQDAVVQVTKVADILVKYPEDRIRVEGHTDSTGPDAYNQELSLRRADAVARVLLARGVKSEQIMTAGFGENQPVADNSSLSGRQANRRVQLYIDIPQSQQEKVEQKALRNRS